MRALTRRNFIVGSASFTALLSNHKAFSQSSNLTDLTISEASRLIRTGAISPVELTQAYLDRISDLNPHLNAFITVTEDLALNIAYGMEEELSRGNWRGPLHGIPLALKDNIDTEGTLTTAASEVFANRTPSKDAEVVLRLKKAGAVP
ncbi:MAG: amidase, partial [Gammaproteobacteria bacterium]|nr:amidase [Gammaproteobacteria bacterium]